MTPVPLQGASSKTRSNPPSTYRQTDIWNYAHRWGLRARPRLEREPEDWECGKDHALLLVHLPVSISNNKPLPSSSAHCPVTSGFGEHSFAKVTAQQF